MKNKRLRNDAVEMLVFTMVVMILLALIIKALTHVQEEHDKELNQITEEEVVKHSFDEPKDYAKDSTLSIEKIRVYEHLYEQK